MYIFLYIFYIYSLSVTGRRELIYQNKMYIDLKVKIHETNCVRNNRLTGESYYG